MICPLSKASSKCNKVGHDVSHFTTVRHIFSQCEVRSETVSVVSPILGSDSLRHGMATRMDCIYNYVTLP